MFLIRRKFVSGVSGADKKGQVRGGEKGFSSTPTPPGLVEDVAEDSMPSPQTNGNTNLRHESRSKNNQNVLIADRTGV
jgi:hypothetical protein